MHTVGSQYILEQPSLFEFNFTYFLNNPYLDLIRIYLIISEDERGLKTCLH